MQRHFRPSYSHRLVPPFRRWLVLCLFLSALSITGCRPDRNEKHFAERIALMENNPADFAAASPDTVLPADGNPEQAEAFLLAALARNGSGPSVFPAREDLESCIRIFSAHRRTEAELEALLLLSAFHRNRNELEAEVATLENAIRTARRENREQWLYLLYSRLSDMYFQEFDPINYARCRTLAEQSLPPGAQGSSDIRIRIAAARNLLYAGKPAEAGILLESAAESIPKTHLRYAECHRLLGMALFGQQEWESSIAEMEQALERETSDAGRFTAYAILTYCHYHLGERHAAEQYRDKAIACDRAGRSGYGEIEFYKVCAAFSAAYGRPEEQTEYLQQVIGKYDRIVRELNGQTIEGAIRAYTHVLEKKAAARRIRLYRYAVSILLTAIVLLVIRHLNQRRIQAYRLLTLERRIQSLESFRQIRDEAREIILKDLDITRQIARLKCAREEKDEKLLKELDRLDLFRDNHLLPAHWDRFYRHIDLSFDNFHRLVVSRFPELNEKEIQLCCLLRAGFKTDEIAAVWLQSVYSVHKYKTQIRKKIKAPEGADIVPFILSGGPLPDTSGELQGN